MSNLPSIVNTLVSTRYIKNFGVYNLHRLVATDLSERFKKKSQNLSNATSALFEVQEHDRDPYYLYASTSATAGVESEGTYGVLSTTGLLEQIGIVRGSEKIPVVSLDSDYFNAELRLVNPFTSEQIDTIINQTYSSIQHLTFFSTELKPKFDWTFDKLSKRREVFNLGMKGQIAPDAGANFLMFSASTRCENECFFCPAGGNLTIFPIEVIDDNLEDMIGFVDEFHNGDFSQFFDIFIGGNDILFLMKYAQRNGDLISINEISQDYSQHLGVPDPLQVIQAFYDRIPIKREDATKKLSAFIEAQNILWMVNNFDTYRDFYKYRARQMGANTHLINKTYASWYNYFRHLFNHHTLSRSLIGYEIADDNFSAHVLGKAISIENKLRAIRVLLDNSGLEKLKIVCQYGFGMQVPSILDPTIIFDRKYILNSLDETARQLYELANEYNRHSLRVVVELSENQAIGKVRKNQSHPNYIPYLENEREDRIAEEIASFTNYFGRSLAIRTGYENALRPIIKMT